MRLLVRGNNPFCLHCSVNRIFEKREKLRIERKKRKIIQCGVGWLNIVIPFTSFNDLRNLLQALLLTVLMAAFTMAVPMEIAAKVLIN